MTKKTKINLNVNVDDVAIFPGTMPGVVELWKAGVISSVSVIAFGSDFENSANILKAYNINTGVHLALNHGKGVLLADLVPSLHSPDGTLWNTVEETLSHLVIDQARAEFEAQINRLIDAGVEIKHLDSHMGLIFMNKELLELYVELGIKYNLTLALPESELFDAARKRMEAASLKATISLNGVYSLTEGLDETLENRKDEYTRLLAQLKPGLNYIYSHPTPLSDASKIEFENDYTIRGNDYKLFLSPEWKEMLKQANVTISRF